MRPFRQRLPHLLSALSAATISIASAELPPINDSIGFASPFAGTLNGQLAIAGGANFPEKLPWEGGQKIWHSSIHLLASPTATWKTVGHLSLPLAYGCSFPVEDGILCVGGSDTHRHHARSFLLRLRPDGTPTETEWPPLPTPLANAAGVRIRTKLFIVGGHTAPDQPPLASVITLDLEHPESGWKSLPPLPGPGRILAAVGHHDGYLYAVSGTDIIFERSSQRRVPLRDAFRYHPESGWEQIPDLPEPRIAAPSPMLESSEGPVIPGGDDGSQLKTPLSQHKGFPRSTLRFNPTTNRWERGPELPVGIATAATVRWHGQDIIPGGEIRPGIRTTRVFSFPKQTAAETKAR
jgi:N-acetylneuraminic acid mutarotase